MFAKYHNDVPRLHNEVAGSTWCCRLLKEVVEFSRIMRNSQGCCRLHKGVADYTKDVADFSVMLQTSVWCCKLKCDVPHCTRMLHTSQEGCGLHKLIANFTKLCKLYKVVADLIHLSQISLGFFSFQNAIADFTSLLQTSKKCRNFTRLLQNLLVFPITTEGGQWK
jgi:hypothetical protein